MTFGNIALSMIHCTTSRRTNPITANVTNEIRLSLHPTNSPVTALKITIAMAIRLAAIATPTATLSFSISSWMSYEVMTW